MNCCEYFDETAHILIFLSRAGERMQISASFAIGDFVLPVTTMIVAPFRLASSTEALTISVAPEKEKQRTASCFLIVMVERRFTSLSCR